MFITAHVIGVDIFLVTKVKVEATAGSNVNSFKLENGKL